MTERLNSVDIVTGDFAKAGWQIQRVPKHSLLYVPTTGGQFIRCIDPRYDRNSPPETLGPAVPGGVFGIAALMDDRRPGEGFTDKVGRAVEMVVTSGYKAASHGDFTNGEVKGCKMLYALTHGLFNGVQVEEEEIRWAMDKYNIHHIMLNGKAKPEGFAINDEAKLALLPRRSMYVTNIGYLDELGLNPRTYSPKLVEIANLVTTEEVNRRMILPMAA